MNQILRWSYKTVHFEHKKEGILGGSFLDDEEIEISLNKFGMAGWELVSLMNIQDGVLAIFKQPISIGSSNVEVLHKEIIETVVHEPFADPKEQTESEILEGSYTDRMDQEDLETFFDNEQPGENLTFEDSRDIEDNNDDDDDDDGVGVIRIE